MKSLTRVVFLLCVLIVGCSKGPPPKIDIHDVALQSEYVSMEVTGQDLDVVNVRVTAKSRGFDFVIPAGTRFVNGDSDYQNMMVARSVTVSFRNPSDLLQQNVQLDVYCINLHRQVPTTDNTFTVGSYEPQSPLVQFVQCLESKSEEKEIKQMAVWIMSDNPTLEEYISQDTIDMVFNRESFRVLVKELQGVDPTPELLDKMMDQFREVPIAQLRELMKPKIVSDMGPVRRLFYECAVPTADRYLLQDDLE